MGLYCLMKDNNKQKRVIYLSQYRGTKEADMLIGAFAKAKVDMMSDEELEAFACLLERDDLDMVNWMLTSGQEITAENDAEQSLFDMIRHFVDYEYKV